MVYRRMFLLNLFCDYNIQTRHRDALSFVISPDMCTPQVCILHTLGYGQCGKNFTDQPREEILLTVIYRQCCSGNIEKDDG
jgi:hypothetical protein